MVGVRSVPAGLEADGVDRRVDLGYAEDLRKKVLDALFGAEEEFEYTSTTAPAATPTPPSASETTSSTS